MILGPKLAYSYALPIVPKTQRLMVAMKRLQEATDALVAATSADDAAAIRRATKAFKMAELELDAATIDAKSREKVGDGGRRRDRAISREQEAMRERLLSILEIDAAIAQTPAGKGVRIGTDVEPVFREALDKWAKACHMMGIATVARQMLVASILRAGRPPGWDGEWPPSLDGE